MRSLQMRGAMRISAVVGWVCSMGAAEASATLTAVIKHNAPDATVVKLAETPEITPLASEQTQGVPETYDA